MIRFIRKIIKPKYETLNKIEIKSSNIIANYQILKNAQPEAIIFPVLKSNAYGHGLKEVCEILNKTDAPMIAIDSFPEAQIAYQYFKRRVLILGEMPLSAYPYCYLSRTDFCVYNKESLILLARLGKARVHLFFNSGMNREGIRDLENFLIENKSLLEKVKIVGFCSHLASADQEDSALNQKQLTTFLHGLDILQAAGYFPEYVHLGNSAAIFTSTDKRLTAFRSGLALYGYNPFSKETKFISLNKLRPALRLTSTVVSIQNIEAGESVSYNETYHAQKNTKIAVIPFGYYEGLNRLISNQASFIYNLEGNKYLLPIAGQVCMNLCCLDVGEYAINIGDKIEIISLNNKDNNSVVNLSVIGKQIPYELLVRLQANIRREII